MIRLPPRQSEPVETPEVKRRRLRIALRHAREAARLTQKETSEALDWSVSKIIRIEAGAVGAAATDLDALIDIYGVADEGRQAELRELARGARKRSWWEYSDVYSLPTRTLFGYEAAANSIYKYEPTFIPGLLQTEEYARALLSHAVHSGADVERTVRARLERQEFLTRDPWPQLEFILDEAVLSRPVGGIRVMRRQLEHLKDLAGHPGISLQVLPFEVEEHPRMGEAFTILEFADESLDDLIYLENAERESVIRHNPELIAAYLRDFVALQDMASPSIEFKATIERIMATGYRLPANAEGRSCYAA